MRETVPISVAFDVIMFILFVEVVVGAPGGFPALPIGPTAAVAIAAVTLIGGVTLLGTCDRHSMLHSDVLHRVFVIRSSFVSWKIEWKVTNSNPSPSFAIPMAAWQSRYLLETYFSFRIDF